MIEKRFEVVMNEFDEVEYIMDKVMMEDRDFAEFIDFVETVCKENEQLKTTIHTGISSRRVSHAMKQGMHLDVCSHSAESRSLCRSG